MLSADRHKKNTSNGNTSNGDTRNGNTSNGNGKLGISGHVVAVTQKKIGDVATVILAKPPDSASPFDFKDLFYIFITSLAPPHTIARPLPPNEYLPAVCPF
jgi:hypothetical protein